MKRGKKIRVLVVDDSALMRKAMRQILEADPEIEVVATARDGEDGVNKARELQPNVVTMDINMPGMDGVTALQYIMAEEICPVVMVSSLTREGALVTFESIELGAFDYVPKPGGTISANLRAVSEEIISKVKGAAKSGTLGRIRNSLQRARERSAEQNTSGVHPAAPRTGSQVNKAVCIGISTGGPKTIMEVLPLLPADLDAALFLVQHMPANFTATFAKRLDQHCAMSLKEAEGGDLIRSGQGYLAKGGHHLLLRARRDGEALLRLATTPQHLFIPSVDIMMSSVLEVFGARTVGVLMTGMGDDGADSMVQIRRSGGITIAESEETATVYGMPKEAIDRGGAEIIAPSYRIAGEIVRALRRMD